MNPTHDAMAITSRGWWIKKAVDPWQILVQLGPSANSLGANLLPPSKPDSSDAAFTLLGDEPEKQMDVSSAEKKEESGRSSQKKG